MLTCDELNIPTRLRQNDNKEEPDFSKDLYLYRRFQPDIDYEFEGHISIAAISQHFKPEYNISVNRSSFCQYPTDVLYDAEKLPHRFSWGVMQAIVTIVDGHTFKSVLGDNSTVTVRFQVKHSPLICMYPHTEMLIHKNNVLIKKKINSESLKTDIQEELRFLFRVCHRPNPHFIPPQEITALHKEPKEQTFFLGIRKWLKKIFRVGSQ